MVSPVVRMLARDNRIDVATLAGSGPDGLVVRKDVEAAIAGGPSFDGERRPIQRAAAELFTRSRREIPEATVWVDCDATEFLRVRAEINAADPDRPVSILALVARFCVLGLRRYPELNSRIDGDNLLLQKQINLGIATQTPHGLTVPVVPDAGSLNARELAVRLAELKQRTPRPEAMTGGTFTVNNYGVFGVDGSAAIINHPEVAILGIGRILDRPWVVDGELAVRKVTELTLAFDHRACDGAVAGGFLRFVADCIERPVVLLGEL